MLKHYFHYKWLEKIITPKDSTVNLVNSYKHINMTNEHKGSNNSISLNRGIKQGYPVPVYF